MIQKIELKIPSAAEARATIELKKQEQSKELIAFIEEKINSAIARGNYHIIGSLSLNNEIKASLTEMGYTYTEEYHSGSFRWTISWKKSQVIINY